MTFVIKYVQSNHRTPHQEMIAYFCFVPPPPTTVSRSSIRRTTTLLEVGDTALA